MNADLRRSEKEHKICAHLRKSTAMVVPQITPITLIQEKAGLDWFSLPPVSRAAE